MSVNFDHVQINYLENIVFRLDNIDIDKLSGKLILGYNVTRIRTGLGQCEENSGFCLQSSSTFP